MADINRPRRYYLGQRQQAVIEEDWAMAGVWRTKQEAQPGVLLAEGFPHRAALEKAGYTTREDIDGADEEELVRVGFSSREAKAILAAMDEGV